MIAHTIYVYLNLRAVEIWIRITCLCVTTEPNSKESDSVSSLDVSCPDSYETGHESWSHMRYVGHDPDPICIEIGLHIYHH